MDKEWLNTHSVSEQARKFEGIKIELNSCPWATE